MQRKGTQIGDIRFDNPRSSESDIPVGPRKLSPHPRLLNRHILADESPTRKIPINAERLSFVSTKASEPSAKKPKLSHKLEPHTLYHEFMSLDQAGPAIMAFDSTPELYAIKKYKRNAGVEAKGVRPFSESDCVVSVIEVYPTLVDVCIVYESMDVSLRHILAIPRGQLVPHEIGAICREVGLFALWSILAKIQLEVIHGLLFIHRTLHTFHGSLDCGQVLANRRGQVKIGELK